MCRDRTGEPPPAPSRRGSSRQRTRGSERPGSRRIAPSTSVPAWSPDLSARLLLTTLRPGENPMQPTQTNTASIASTGISGLDEILGGGLPKHHVFLIQGDPGAGKTTLSLQFLLEGARNNE